MSITSFIQLSHFFIQFKCLNAPDQNDKYCHDHSDQINRWNQMIWPCRELQLNENTNKDDQHLSVTNHTVSQKIFCLIINYLKNLIKIVLL